MNIREASEAMGFSKHWLSVLKNRSQEKYDYLSGFDSDLLKSLRIAEARITMLIHEAEEACFDRDKKRAITALELYKCHKYQQIEVLKDNLFMNRDRPLSTRYSLILKLERIKEVL